MLLQLQKGKQTVAKQHDFFYVCAFSARRGYEVYKQVCAACHSVNYLHYRELVGHIMTADEAKAEAAEVSIKSRYGNCDTESRLSSDTNLPTFLSPIFPTFSSKILIFPTFLF